MPEENANRYPHHPVDKKVLKMKRKLLAVGLSVLAAAAQAEVVNYKCELHSIEARGWIPPEVWLSVDAENKRARAYDGAIRASNELAGISPQTPADTKFKVIRSGEYRLSWHLTLQAKVSGSYRVAYTATFDPNTSNLKLRASFPQANASNRPSGSGACKPVSSPNLY